MEKTQNRALRTRSVRKRLQKGDVSVIARRAGVSRVWASYVLNGSAVSEKVLRAAEALVAERNTAKQERI